MATRKADRTLQRCWMARVRSASLTASYTTNRDTTNLRGEATLPDQTYRMVGVRWWGEGAYSYKTILGSQTQAAQLYRIEAGDLLINKIWARNGSIAVAGEEMGGAYGSSEFPTFVLDRSKIEPRYVHWFSSTRLAWTQCELLSRGTSGKNRVRPEQFLSVVVPLPPLSEQRRIVERLDAAATAIDARSRAATCVDAEIDAMLAAAFARIIADAPRRPMAEVAPLVRRPVQIDPDAVYPELGVRSFGRGLFIKPDVVGAEVTWQSLYRIEAGDLVFSNIKAWEGAFAVAGPEHAGKHGSHRYLTCVPDRSLASAGYLWYYLQTDAGLRQIGQASVGSADRNRTLATKRLASINLPVPSLDAQHWFDGLQAKARLARLAQTAAATELAALLPAMLHQAFGDGVSTI